MVEQHDVGASSLRQAAVPLGVYGALLVSLGSLSSGYERTVTGPAFACLFVGAAMLASVIAMAMKGSGRR